MADAQPAASVAEKQETAPPAAQPAAEEAAPEAAKEGTTSTPTTATKPETPEVAAAPAAAATEQQPAAQQQQGGTATAGAAASGSAPSPAATAAAAGATAAGTAGAAAAVVAVQDQSPQAAAAEAAPTAGVTAAPARGLGSYFCPSRPSGSAAAANSWGGNYSSKLDVFRSGALRYANPYYHATPTVTLTEFQSLSRHIDSLKPPQPNEVAQWDGDLAAALRMCHSLKWYRVTLDKWISYASLGYSLGTGVDSSALTPLNDQAKLKLYCACNAYVALLRQEAIAKKQMPTIAQLHSASNKDRYDAAVAESLYLAKKITAVFNRLAPHPYFKSGSLLSILGTLLRKGGETSLCMLVSLLGMGSVAYYGGVGALLVGNPVVGVAAVAASARAIKTVWDERDMVYQIDLIRQKYGPTYEEMKKMKEGKAKTQRHMQLVMAMATEVCVRSFAAGIPVVEPNKSTARGGFVLG